MAAGTLEREIADIADDIVAGANRIVELQQRLGELNRMSEWAAFQWLAASLRAAELGGRR